MSVSVLNTNASVSGKTVTINENADTVTGLKTFDRDPSAPFAVSSGSAVVVNLDADKLDGQDGSFYQSASNINAGNLSVARMPNVVQTPGQFSGDQNNYNPTGISTAQLINFSSDAARNVTGLQGGSTGRILVVSNVGNFNITLVHQSASSSAANRFLCANSANVVIRPNGSVILCYLSAALGWVVVGA